MVSPRGSKIFTRPPSFPSPWCIGPAQSLQLGLCRILFRQLGCYLAQLACKQGNGLGGSKLIP